MTATKTWTARDIPDLTGKTVVVTGANSGLGLETSRELARKGAKVVLACRNVDKGTEAAQDIRGDSPQAALEVMSLDLGDLSSVRTFAQVFEQTHERLDILVNNAGVMALPRSTTVDGFETQIGTNHLGHFALTGLLLKTLLSAPAGRVVTVSSLVHKTGRIDFDDLDGERRYNKWTAYGQSKLANLMFTFELQRRFEAAGVNVISVGCHPGYASTNLQRNWARSSGVPLMDRMSGLAVGIAGQNARSGALPTLYAATDPNVQGGDIIGPGGFMQVRGHPVKVSVARRAHDREIAARLWSLSVERTGVSYHELPS
jgi:NAD(P)-dependent dehydrogenase (short-subunit alcohol dehydrogenase family)